MESKAPYFSIFDITMKKLVIFLSFFTSFCIAEEKGMWQKFVDFFSPSPSVDGNSELEQNIQKLDKKIQSTKNDYNREHRPQRKSMLKREIEDLTHERDSLLTVYESQKNISSLSTIESSSSITATSSSELANEQSSSSLSSSSSSFASSESSQAESSSESIASSTSEQTIPASPVISQPTEQCDTVWIIQKKVVHDTIFIRDTVIVHDTIHVHD